MFSTRNKKNIDTFWLKKKKRLIKRERTFVFLLADDVVDGDSLSSQ